MQKIAEFHLLALACFISGKAFAAETFLDAEIDFNENWEVLDTGTRDAFTESAQFIVGGNPDNFGVIRNRAARRNVPSVVYGWYLNTDAVYQPAIDGAIDTIDYSEDHLRISGSSGGQSSGIALRQGGDLYAAIDKRFTAGRSVDWLSSSTLGLSESDFALIFLNPLTNRFDFIRTENPDFSAQGSAIEFGFMRANGSSAGEPYDQQVGIDNWSVTVNNVPEPSSLVLLAMTGLASIRRRRGFDV